mmetsp:Transcript_56336/g.142496  ORF Transcript_56336/g.142496 Transcript_56336/m.142496 type:complete len:216 (-) Transcript_56336:210-857(-)
MVPISAASLPAEDPSSISRSAPFAFFAAASFTRPSKSSVSSRYWRKKMRRLPGASEVRYGSRHPHANMSALLRLLSMMKTTMAATVHAPKAPLTEIHERLKPSVSRGEISLMYTAAVDSSPPALKPCKALNTKSVTKPNHPHVSPQHENDGKQPCKTVVTSMSKIVNCIAGFRPNLSAKNPKNAPPRGRKAKVMAKPAHVPTLPPRPSAKKLSVM